MKNANGTSIATQGTNTTIGISGSQSPMRLDAWKDIAAYFNRSVRTVQRWEALENMPVHRHIHATGGSLFAYRHELDAWRTDRSQHGREHPTFPVTKARTGSLF